MSPHQKTKECPYYRHGFAMGALLLAVNDLRGRVHLAASHAELIEKLELAP